MSGENQSGSGKDPRIPRRVDREEQGELLADAVTGFSGGEGRDPAPEVEKESPTAESSPTPSGETLGEEEVADDVETIPESPWEQKMAWANQRSRDGRQDEAEELYKELVKESPDNVRALNNLGVLLDEMGRHEEAVSYLRVAKEVEPQNSEVLGNLGAALGALGRYSDAENELRLAYRLDSSNLQIRGNLGILLFRRGLYEQAVTELSAVCSAQPEDGMPFFYMGEALNRLGRVDEAIEALTRVTELSPRISSKAFYTLGVLYDKKNEPEQASAMYRKARGSGNQ